MGTFSAFHRFREAGEEANVRNVEQFGEPVRSLFTETQVLSLHHHIDITDEAENIVYQASSKAISLHDKTAVTDAAGKAVCSIERKLVSIHAKHKVTMADGTVFVLSNELLHIVKDVITIKELGWKLKGDVLGMNYELYDGNDQVIAVVSQKMISLHDKYCMDIYRPELEPFAVAILVTLEHMIQDRENADHDADFNDD